MAVISSRCFQHDPVPVRPGLLPEFVHRIGFKQRSGGTNGLALRFPRAAARLGEAQREWRGK
jgi:hypothetical protein